MLNMAIIGAGFIAHNHAVQIAKMKDIRLCGVVEIDGDRGRAFAQQYATKYYPDIESLIKENSVDIADICLPTHLHEEYAVKCAKLGMHVLCEKPFALSHGSAGRMVDACRENGVKLMVAQVLRFWPDYQEIKRIAAAGELGEVKLAHFKRLSSLPAWSSFYDTPSMSGGGVYDLLLHDVDFAFYLFGEVKSVYAVGYQNGKGAWNNQTAVLNFESGTRAVVTACQEMSANYPFTMGARLLGEKGTIEFKYEAKQLLRGGAETSLVKYLNGAGEPERVEVAPGDGYYNEIRYFADCVLEGREPNIAPPEECIRVLRVIEAVRESLENAELINI